MKKREFNIASLMLFTLLSSRLFAAETLVYTDGGRRDPFIPLIGPGGVQTSKSRGDMHLEGIIYDPPAGSLVLINGEFYKQGQRIGESTVMSILKDRVVLLQDDEQKTLWVREEILPKGETNEQKKVPSAIPKTKK